MATITFQGLGSGLQVGEIVEAIVNAEKVPYESRISYKESITSADISAAGSLKSALEEVQTALAGIADTEAYQQRTVSGADDYISITSSSDAGIGTYDIKVDVLASAHKLVSEEIDSEEAVGEGRLSISSGENSFTIDVSSTETLSEIRDKINDSTDNDSVNATIITDDNGQRLVFSSKETGVANAITVTVDDIGDTNNTDTVGLSRLASLNLTEATKAIDAQITIDNTITISSATNEFVNVIDGIDITAKKVQSVDDSDSQISITEDNSNIEKSLTEFVSAYNKLVDLNSNFGQVGKGKSGVMIGDSLLRGVMSKIRNEFTASFDFGGDGTLTLSELGIRSDQYGKMSIDSDDLNEYIDNNVDNVQQLLVGTDSKPGFAATLTTILDFYTESDGLLQGRIDSKELKLEKLSDERLAFTRKMDSLEARLYAQYNAMDLLVAGLNSTSSYLMQQLDNMPGVVRNS
ncbi:MAG: flagellar filament capping protein FliD [Colwellia sp.]|nr:flagellar filament capping protein FliD [Colwellia sp.]